MDSDSRIGVTGRSEDDRAVLQISLDEASDVLEPRFHVLGGLQRGAGKHHPWSLNPSPKSGAAGLVHHAEAAELGDRLREDRDFR